MLVIETARLLLREFALDDVPALAAIHADPAVARYIGGVRTVEETRDRVAEFIADYAHLGFSKCAMVLRATGELIGRCGPQVVRIGERDEIELGYTMARHCRGQGDATEAGTAALAQCFDALGHERVVSVIHADNDASKRITERLGMVFEHEVSWKGEPSRVFARHRRTRDAALRAGSS